MGGRLGSESEFFERTECVLIEVSTFCAEINGSCNYAFEYFNSCFQS